MTPKKTIYLKVLSQAKSSITLLSHFDNRLDILQRINNNVGRKYKKELICGGRAFGTEGIGKYIRAKKPV